MPCSPPIRFCSIVGQASIQTARTIGPSTMERSSGLDGSGRAGIFLAGEGLQASSKGVRVRFSGAKRTVIDGPFTETKELIAGFWLWQVKSLNEAIEWLKRAPFQEGDVEIRQVFEADDFGPA